MALKNKKFKLKFHTRSIIAGAFVLLICAAAYVDHTIGKKQSGGDYLYTANSDIASDNKNEMKILGEAAFVDSNEQIEESLSASSEVAEYDTYFSVMQIDRQRSRDEAYEILQNVIDSADSMPDVKEQAYAEMMEMANNITVESNICSMVKAKGFEDCITVINGDNINVIVKTNGLLTNEVAQIKEIAVNESGFSPENIRIVEKGY